MLVSQEAKSATRSILLRSCKLLFARSRAVEVVLVFTLKHLLPEDVCGGVS